MDRTGRRARMLTGAAMTAVLCGAATAAVAFSGPGALPLRPLATAQPPLDGYQHVLVRVSDSTPVVPVGATTAPAGRPTVPGPAVSGPAVPDASGTAGVDLAALARYQGRVDRLERSADGRVLAILTDGSSVDVTAGGGAHPAATGPAGGARGPAGSPAAPAASATAAPPAAVHAAGKPVPAPLLALAADPGVVDISPVDASTWRVTGDLPADRVAKLTGLPTQNDVLMQLTGADDTYWSLLWALENDGGSIGGYLAVPDADVDGVEADRRGTGTGVVVAVVDSGVQPDHPDLPPLWHNAGEICGNGIDDDHNGYVDDCDGWDFVHNDNTPYDPGDNNDHGTHVTGTIAAIPHNGRGTAGLAPGATIMNVKVTANGSMYMSDVAKAIRYAADNGAKIINASLGSTPGTPIDQVQPLQDAIAYAGGKGVLVVAAAGNDGINTDSSPVWPADLPLDNIISVGASTPSEQRATFSNYGTSSVDLFAPGFYIVSTVDKGGYAAMQGTSMATPHVAAAAALVLSADPGLSPAEVKQRLMETVDPEAAYRGYSVSGGRLNADQALAASGVAVEASAFNDFSADTPHTGNLTVRTAPGTVPAGVAVTPQATLLTQIDSTTYGVVDQAVTVDGNALTTDANAQVTLGPAAGVDGADPTLNGDGMRMAVGMTLPAGRYALVVDLVSTADPTFEYGRSNAIIFQVLAPGEAPPTAAPTASPTPGVPSVGDGQPPVVSDPGTGPVPTALPSTTAPAPSAGGAPGAGTAPGSGPTGGTAPSAASTPGGTSKPGGGTAPGGGIAPGGGAGPGSGPAPRPVPTSAPWPTATSAPWPMPTGASWPTATSAPWPMPTGAPWPTATSAPWPGGTAAPTTTRPPSTGTGPSPVTADGITITSLTPGNGPATGGTAVMIIGSGFPAYPVVSIGGVGAYVQSANPYIITVLTPSGVPGSVVSVTVGDRTGRSVTLPNAFRYDAGSASGDAPGATPTAPAGTPTAPGATPTAPGSTPTGPVGPPGASARTIIVFGQPTVRGGMHLAPALNYHLSPDLWTTSLCQTVLCRGVAI